MAKHSIQYLQVTDRRDVTIFLKKIKYTSHDHYEPKRFKSYIYLQK